MAFPIVFLLFVGMPILEIFVLIQVGSSIGALATIAIVVFTAILGTWLLRAQGLSTLGKARSRLAGGEIPAFQLLEGLALGVGGALLLTPGFITDAFGFACLFPPTRHLLVNSLSKRFSVTQFSSGGFTGQTRSNQTPPGQQNRQPPRGGSIDGDVIEGEYTRKD